MKPGSCGPVLWEKAPLPCYSVDSQNYYYANVPNQQFTFRAINDTMAITNVSMSDEDFQTPGLVDALVKTAQAIGASLQPADKTKFTNFEFQEGLGL